MVADCHHIRGQHIHDLDRREALKLTVDQRAAEHITGDGIDNIFLLIANLFDITRQMRNAPNEFFVHLLCKEVPVKVI